MNKSSVQRGLNTRVSMTHSCQHFNKESTAHSAHSAGTRSFSFQKNTNKPNRASIKKKRADLNCKFDFHYTLKTRHGFYVPLPPSSITAFSLAIRTTVLPTSSVSWTHLLPCSLLCINTKAWAKKWMSDGPLICQFRSSCCHPPHIEAF